MLPADSGTPFVKLGVPAQVSDPENLPRYLCTPVKTAFTLGPSVAIILCPLVYNYGATIDQQKVMRLMSIDDPAIGSIAYWFLHELLHLTTTPPRELTLTKSMVCR